MANYEGKKNQFGKRLISQKLIDWNDMELGLSDDLKYQCPKKRAKLGNLN